MSSPSADRNQPAVIAGRSIRETTGCPLEVKHDFHVLLEVIGRRDDFHPKNSRTGSRLPRSDSLRG